MHHDLLKTANTEHLHVKSMEENACGVFKIVNSIAPTFIQILITFKCSQYAMRNDKTAVVPNTSKYGIKSFVHDGVWNSLPNELQKN